MMDLVTGETGHIGNVLVRQLLTHGRKVRALVHPGKTVPSLADLNVECVSGDVLYPESLALPMEGVDVVYHLAARVSLGSGPEPETERINLVGTRNVIAAARRSGVRRLAYAGSVYALRIPGTGIVDENLPFDPDALRGEYDRSKALASLEVLQAAASGLDAVIVCPTAVVGPFDFRRSEAGRGILYNISSGFKFYVDGAYDFVDVRDVAAGCILAAEKGRKGEVYILGGERLSVREAAEAVWGAAGGWHVGIHLPDWIANWAAGIMPVLLEDPIVTPYSLGAVRSNSCISHNKASVELGYQPRPAREAIRDAVLWWQGELAGFPYAKDFVEALP